MESLRKRQKVYIRERNRKMRAYGTVIGCLLIAVITVSVIPQFTSKADADPESVNVTEFEMRLQSITGKNAPETTNSGPQEDKTVYYTATPGMEISRYTFASDGDFDCVTSSEGYEQIDKEISAITTLSLPAEENEIVELDLHTYFVRWHNRDGYYALYAENTTKDNFTDVYRKLTQD